MRLLLICVKGFLKPLNKAQTLGTVCAKKAVKVCITVELQYTFTRTFADDKKVIITIKINLLRLIGASAIVGFCGMLNGRL